MNFIIRGVINGGPPVELKPLGIPEAIRLVWTVLDEQKLLTAFDPQTGEPRTVSLQEAKPRHWETAFVEDRIHDWNIRKGLLYFHGHSSEKGDSVDILIQT